MKNILLLILIGIAFFLFWCIDKSQEQSVFRQRQMAAYIEQNNELFSPASWTMIDMPVKTESYPSLLLCQEKQATLLRILGGYDDLKNLLSSHLGKKSGISDVYKLPLKMLRTKVEPNFQTFADSLKEQFQKQGDTLIRLLFDKGHSLDIPIESSAIEHLQKQIKKVFSEADNDKHANHYAAFLLRIAIQKHRQQRVLKILQDFWLAKTTAKIAATERYFINSFATEDDAHLGQAYEMQFMLEQINFIHPILGEDSLNGHPVIFDHGRVLIPFQAKKLGKQALGIKYAVMENPYTGERVNLSDLNYQLHVIP